MKLLHILIFIVLVLVYDVSRADTWRTEDTVREVGYQVLHVIDWGQTKHGANHCDVYIEVNSVLGVCPSMNRVNTYFISTSLLHWGISSLLSHDARKVWQYLTIGMEVGVVANNYSLGIKVDF